MSKLDSFNFNGFNKLANWQLKFQEEGRREYDEQARAHEKVDEWVIYNREKQKQKTRGIDEQMMKKKKKRAKMKQKIEALEIGEDEWIINI